MNSPKLYYSLVISLVIAILITAISYSLNTPSGRIFVQPGIYVQAVLQGVLLLIPSGDFYISLPRGSYLVFNVVIYSVVIFGFFVLISLAYQKR